jgi:hypothetical protein
MKQRIEEGNTQKGTRRKPHLEQRRRQRRQKATATSQWWPSLLDFGFSPDDGEDSFQKYAAIRQ